MSSNLKNPAREAILSRINMALLPTPESQPEDHIATSWSAIPRTFRHDTQASPQDVLHLLIDRLHDYDAQVLTCTPSGITESIAKMLTARGVRKLLLPAGFPEDILPQGFEYIPDGREGESLTAAQLDATDGVITLSTLAIAETGTLVLQNVPGQGRRAASLVPDYHLCLVNAADVKATVPEAVAALQPTAALPTTFISGPSATADIEMTRIKGVHGPRFLDVILISSE
ncbi:LutC/YkgG family protein [Granulicella tundricola]|uniref:LUD domain-containing protein n=1 Tax=Granulicella tundricola (strain ATCC BAA-1859 / DSM 23138 / MP5ACTX9) TaxID=1198114 RepID=E8WZ90_GRATM|nr:LUD domain-containing protein [Granulicella tundricola]ADW67692.1 protein of unknown function DUF162 [Granulicella tundricola MP5ACTX9]